VFRYETEISVKGVVVDEDGEQSEDVEEVSLSCVSTEATGSSNEPASIEYIPVR
jgi:hypothetical protein